MTDPGLTAKVRSGLLWSAVQNWGVRLLSLALFMVMARVLPPADLGLFALVAVVLAFLGMLADQGLSEAVVQRTEISAAQLNAVFWLNLGVASAAAVALMLGAPLLARALGQPALVDLLRVSALALPVTAAGFGQLSIRKRRFEYRWVAKATLAATLVSATVALAMLAAGMGVWSLIGQAVSAALVTTGVLWWGSAWRPTLRTDFRSVRPLVAYGSSRLATQVMDFANTRYIELFLASALGPVSLAVYAVGVRLHQALMQALSSTVLEVAHNGFSRLAGDRAALLRAYHGSMATTAMVAVPVFLLVAAVAQPLTLVVFGARWADSAEVMRLMSLLGAVQVLQFYNGTVYNAIGRPEVGLYFMVVKVVLTFGALAMAHDAGLHGLLLAYLASQLATTPMSFLLARHLVGVSLRMLARQLWPFLSGGAWLMAAAGAVVHVCPPSMAPLLVLLLAVLAGAAVYLVWLRVVAPASLRSAMGILRPARAATASALE